MFKFLKGKLKDVAENFSKKTEEEIAEEEQVPEDAKSSKQPQTESLEKEEAPKETTEEKQTQDKEESAQQSSEKTYLRKTIDEVRNDLKKKSEEIKKEESKGFFTKIKDAIKKKKTPQQIQTESEEKTSQEATEEKQTQERTPEETKIPEPTKPEEEAPHEQTKDKEESVPEKQKTGFFKKVTQALSTKKISEKKFEELFEEMEIALLENNVALEVIDKIKEDLKSSVVGVPLRIGKVESTVIKTLRESINGLFVQENLDIVELAKQKKPYVIMFVGINGSGKTTTIAKIARLLQENDLKSVMAAADTFRAAAIQQLQEHADKLNVKLVKHDYGSDPAAVAFDAVKYAESNNVDVVLVDTAGRQHNNKNLMEEVKKIVRVSNPDLKIFIGESITGNDCVEQAENFNQAVGIDGIILTKADVDEKGGAAISISHVTKKPIIYLGTGQEYSDLKSFNPSIIMESLELNA